MKVCFIVRDSTTGQPVPGADVVLYDTYLGKTDNRGVICGEVEPKMMVTPVRYTIIKQGYKPLNASTVLPGKAPPFMGAPPPPSTVTLPVMLTPLHPQPQQPSQPSPTQPPQQPAQPTQQSPPQAGYNWINGILSFASSHAVELSAAAAGIIAITLAYNYIRKRR